MTDQLTVRLREATDADEETVLRIRNISRQHMTRDQEWISSERQRKWWERHRDNGYRIWIAENDSTPVGFCMLHQQGAHWATLALYPEFRGQGIGTRMYEFMAEQCESDVWIEVLLDNAASRRAAEKAGFKEHAIDQTKVLMRRAK